MGEEHGFNKGRTSTGSGNWRTPPGVLADLRAISGWGEWGLDLAATSVDRVVPEYVGPDHPDPSRRDALALTPDQVYNLTWNEKRGRGPVWCNPPYDLWHLFAIVLAEAAAARGVRSCLFVFARTDTIAWHSAGARARAIAFRAGRVRFVDPRTGEPGGSAPAPSAALFFGPRDLPIRGPLGVVEGKDARWHVVRS